nr:hypothetical protein BaRGS_017381 [Batillaria attramentaria]
MLNLALLLLSLILFHVDVGWSQNTLPAKSREQLTKELHDLTIKFDQHLKTHTSAEDIQKMGQVLGEKMTAAITSLGDTLGEQLGEALGDKLTEAIEKLVDVPASCVDVMEYDTSNSVHTLTVNNTQMEVFCDQTTAGGGWVVDFYRNWTDYERGFGDLTHEFWLGLDKIHRLTSSNNYSLRVDLEDFDGSTAYAEYRDFSISGSDDFYRLHVGEYIV